jgi:hypothetical protein
VHDFRHATGADSASAKEAAELLDNSARVAEESYIHDRSYDARQELIAELARLEGEQ